MKSEHFAVNVLIDLYNLGIEAKATFDFVNKTIEPTEVVSKESLQLMNDYLHWLPEHFKNRNCDLTKLEQLRITLWTDFHNTLPYERNQKDRVFTISALTTWKADGRKDKTIELTQSEVIPMDLLGGEKIPKVHENYR